MLTFVLGGFAVFWLTNLLYKTFRAPFVISHPPLKPVDQHDRQVDAIVTELQSFLKRRKPGQKVALRRSRPKAGGIESNRTAAQLYKSTTDPVNVWMLDGVLSVDKARRLITVEPNVEMDELGRYTLAYGLVPQVLLEFPGISVGGALCGGGVESSSHIYGHFFNTVEELDVILGDGTLRRGVSATSDPQLFHSLSASMSTHAIIVKATIRCVDAAEFVQIKYHHFDNPTAMTQTMSTIANAAQPPEFLDGVVVGKHSCISVQADMCDAVPESATFVSLRQRRTDEWFAWHVCNLAPTLEVHSKPKPADGEADAVEYMPLKDYLFRFDRGAFWMARPGLEMFYGSKLTDTAFIRAKYAWLCTTRQLYRMLHKLGNELLARSYIIQDIICPGPSEAVKLMEYNNKELDIYPLWICPIRAVNAPMSHGSCGFGFPRTPKSGLMFNVGIYGQPNGGRPFDPAATNRSLEAEAAKLGARKMMYAQTFDTEDEFWQLYDKPSHDANVRKYDPHGIFVDITKKLLLKPEAVASLGGVKPASLHYAWRPLWSWYFSLWMEWCIPYALHDTFGLTYTRDDTYKS
eukprot:m.490612 g.490612  ORF g.490612 m.490612 type:complete len:576 (-) comp28391_c0_seq1:111-1838(-)